MTGDKKDCYSEGERKWMEYGQKLRGRYLEPLLQFLIRIKITPDQITAISLFAGLLSCPAMLYSKTAALLLLFTHVILDGIDGPLARYAGVESAKGSFVDTAADQLVITCTMLTLMNLGHVGIMGGVIYIFAYTVVVGFAMIRNALSIPYSWLVRPRFAVYAWLVVEFYIWSGSLNYLIWLFNLLLLAKMVSGFIKIKKEL